MRKNRRTKKAMAMALVATMVISLMPVSAFAADSSGGSDYVDSGGTSNDRSEITSISSDEAPGDTSESPINITIDIPNTAADDPDTEKTENKNIVKGDPVGTTTKEGDLPTSEKDKTYDYTETTIVQQGSVTVTTTEITETTTPVQSDMDYAVSETKPDGTNDIVKDTNSAAPEAMENEAPIQSADENTGQGVNESTEAAQPGFEYIGTGNYSQFWASYLYKTPGYEGEPAIFTDKNGQSYYIQLNPSQYEGRTDILAEGFYVDGQQVVDETAGTYPAWYETVNQFVLIDAETGERITTYCADQETPAEKGAQYNMENIEDAAYYSDEQAAMIRTVAKNGYWGTIGYATDEDGNPIYKKDADGNIVYQVKTDADGNIVYEKDTDGKEVPVLEPVPVPKMGSLDAMKDMMRNAYETDADGNVKLDDNGNPIRIFTDDEIDKTLSDGVALTATQYAIWSFSNVMKDFQFINAHYVGTPGAKEITINPNYGAGSLRPVVPESEQASVDLIFKLYHYLTNMAPTSYEDNKTTENTIINAGNFLKDMAVTVLEKVEDHKNNQDDNDKNDVYKTNVSFALVVTPSTENGDDLVVKVLDKNGKELASGRVAGVNDGDETYQTLYADDNGNYTFSNIIMTEGGQEFNITMEGIQNLKEGVYLYTSEVVTEDGTVEKGTSQTMVGIAEGSHGVKVSRNLKFEFAVEDEKVVVKEHHSSGGGSHKKLPGTPPETLPESPEEWTEIPEEDVPLSDVPVMEEKVLGDNVVEEIPETEVPLANGEVILADIPQTNDPSLAFLAMAMLSAAGLFLTRRCREDEK